MENGKSKIGIENLKILITFALSIIIAIIDLVDKRFRSIMSNIFKLYGAFKKLKRSDIDYSLIDDELDDLDTEEKQGINDLIKSHEDLEEANLDNEKLEKVSDIVFTWTISTFTAAKDIIQLLKKNG